MEQLPQGLAHIHPHQMLRLHYFLFQAIAWLRSPPTICLLQEPFPPANCLLDPLHCLLRTSDLIESILYEWANRWGLNAKLEEFCIQNKIPLRIKKIDAETHSVEWYCMNVEERLCLWGKISIEEIFGAYNHWFHVFITNLWILFATGTYLNEEEKTAFTEAVAKWLQILNFIHCSHTESMNCQCDVPDFSNMVINFIR